jgi:hypothetical protein
MSIVGGENSLYSIESAASDFHSLANSQERVTDAPNIIRKEFPHAFDLVVGDRNRLSAHVDESRDASRKQNQPSNLGRHNRVYKQVAGKKRDFNLLPSITPAMSFRERGQESRNALIVQLMCHQPFVSRRRLNGVPVSDFRRD